jgi:membrane glycosyltransferase
LVSSNRFGKISSLFPDISVDKVGRRAASFSSQVLIEALSKLTGADLVLRRVERTAVGVWRVALGLLVLGVEP